MESSATNWKNILNLKGRGRPNIPVVQRTLTGQICKKRQWTNTRSNSWGSKCKRCLTLQVMQNAKTNVIKISVFTNSFYH